MYELMIANTCDVESKMVQNFLDWKKIDYKLIINEVDNMFLNQGSTEPLFMKDNMILARGFYNIVDFQKNGLDL